MSQAQLNATQVLCRVLEQDNAQIDGRGLHMDASEGALHLLREKLLIRDIFFWLAPVDHQIRA